MTRTFCRQAVAGGLLVLAIFCLERGAGAANADTITINMKNGPYRYEPSAVNAKAGDTIEWIGAEDPHTATSDDLAAEPVPNSSILQPSQKYCVTLSSTPLAGCTAMSATPRTVRYHCRVHGTAMSGVIQILP